MFSHFSRLSQWFWGMGKRRAGQGGHLGPTRCGVRRVPSGNDGLLSGRQCMATGALRCGRCLLQRASLER